MKTFINVEDLGDLRQALAEAQEIKNDRFKYQHLGKNKTLLMIFFNNSLRTRLSTQKAAMNLGMNVIVLDVNAVTLLVFAVLLDSPTVIMTMRRLCSTSLSSIAANQYLLWKRQQCILCSRLPTLSLSMSTGRISSAAQR